MRTVMFIHLTKTSVNYLYSCKDRIQEKKIQPDYGTE